MLTQGANYFILVITEYLSKWTEIVLNLDKSTESIADQVLALVYLYGVMKFLMHDQSREFRNKVLDIVTNRLGI